MRNVTMRYLPVVLVIVFVFEMVSSKPAIRDNPQVMCKLPEARGLCRALLPRWRYNPSVGRCQEFMFGGCEGNGNNFVSEKSCMAMCAGIH